MNTWHPRASRAALVASVPLLALVTFAAGCGTTTTPPGGARGGTATAQPPSGKTTTASPAPGSTSPAPVPTTTGGPPVVPGQPACTGWPANAPHGTLPTSFVPVAVDRCQIGYQTIPGKGQWETATLQRADKDLAALIAALRRPIRAPRQPGMMCPQLVIQAPQFVLISADGKTLVPDLPVTGCGLIQEPVLAALAALPWQTVSVRLVSQVQTQQEIASGCTPTPIDPFTEFQPSRLSPGGPVYAAPPASLRICVYSSGSGSAVSSQFLRGTTVTGSTVSALLAGLSGVPRIPACTVPHGMFAVVAGESQSDSPAYVELGGCDRVYRYQSTSGGLMGMTMGQATPEAVAIIESVTYHKPVPVDGAPVAGVVSG
jgi:hypothetical protein